MVIVPEERWIDAHPLVKATRVASLHVFRWRCGDEYNTHQAIKRKSSFKSAAADFILWLVHDDDLSNSVANLI